MENITLGVSTLIIGLGIVMSVLAMIFLIISSFTFFNKPADKTKEALTENKAVQSARTEKPSSAITETVTSQNEGTLNNAGQDDLETICAITVALATLLNTSADKIKIRSIKKLTPSNQRNSNWTRQARIESTIL